jgi:hypothetical protein
LGAYSFPEAVSLIDSVGHLSIKAAGYAWQGLAEAAGTDTSRLDGIAGRVTGDPGEGHPELAGSLHRVSGWAGDTGSFSSRVAQQLLHAGDVAASVYATRVELEQEYNTLKSRMDNPEALPGTAEVRDANRMSELTSQINAEISKLGSAFGAVQPGAPEAVPASGGGGGDAGGAPAASGVSMVQAANGVSVAPGHYPGSSVQGPEAGDFAGWVTDPRTGYLIDPVTGREYDPATGRWVDPVTGKPFGDVARYATRLEGLGGGTPAPATLGVGAGVNIAGLYNGVTPPSLAPGNPATPILTQQATQGLAGKANLAQRLAMREMAQGGRPFGMPAGSTAPMTPRATNSAPRLFSERANAWRARTTAADRLRLGGDAGARRTTPAPGATATAEEKTKKKQRTGLLKDRDAWAVEGRAGRGVLGEEGT